MKKVIKTILITLLVMILVPAVFLGVLFGAITLMTTSGLTSRDAVVRMYEKNEDAFLNAAATGDFSALKEIRGVEDVSAHEDYVDFFCGGSGMGSNTQYYGIFYSPDDNMCKVWGAPYNEKLEPENGGYRWKEPDGDNEYYVEPLGNHFFYYEEKY